MNQREVISIILREYEEKLVLLEKINEIHLAKKFLNDNNMGAGICFYARKRLAIETEKWPCINSRMQTFSGHWCITACNAACDSISLVYYTIQIRIYIMKQILGYE